MPKENKELIPLKDVSAVAVFSEGGMDDLLKKIEKEAMSHVADLTTDKGRKEIASIAYKVSQSKTLLDDLGKGMTADWKAKAKLVDAERSKARTELDRIRDAVRKPLNDWEAADQKRMDTITMAIDGVMHVGNKCVAEYQTMPIKEMQQALDDVQDIIPAECDEFEERMTEVRFAAMAKIEKSIEQRNKYDADQQELADLRVEKEARDAAATKLAEENQRKEQDAQIAKNAREAADKAAKKAIKDKEDAEKRERETSERAERERKESLEREQKAADDARQAEIDKQADAARLEQEEKEKREKNTRHKAKLNNEAVDALVMLKLTPAVAKKIVKAVAQGKIPNITISY